MPHPKKKHTKGRSRQGRSHDALSATVVTTCSKCKKSTRPHHACTFCGTYKGAQRLKVPTKK